MLDFCQVMQHKLVSPLANRRVPTTQYTATFKSFKSFPSDITELCGASTPL